MSKKDKSKFKKQIKAQLFQEVAQVRTIQSQTSSPQKAKVVSKENVLAGNNIVDSAAATPTLAINDEFNLPQIKYDLKKTGIVILCMAIILGFLYYLDSKNGILVHLGDWLFKVFHLS